MGFVKKHYKHEYLGDWHGILGEHQKAYNLWIEYEYKCEIYDRCISQGRKDEKGFIFLTSKELGLSNVNALMIDRVLRRIAMRENIGNKHLSDAKQKVSRLSFSALEREYLFLKDNNKLLME